MKQLSALGARRHPFFRGPRRMRPLGSRLDEPDLLGPGGYGYYGGMRGEKKVLLFIFTSFYTHNQLSFIHSTKAFFSANTQITDPFPHLEITKDSPYSCVSPSLSLTYSTTPSPTFPPIPSFLSIVPSFSNPFLLRMYTTGTVQPTEI